MNTFIETTSNYLLHSGFTALFFDAWLKGLAVLFYIMGLSYGAVSLVRDALAHPLGKTAVY